MTNEKTPEDFADKRYDPVGFCIYCGSREEPLSDEHIIALGLGGTAILPQASCEPCRVETGRVEQRVLRGPMWWVRALKRIRSRNPQDMPTHTPITVIRKGKEEAIELPLNESPIVLFFPIFEPPGVVTGIERPHGITFRYGVMIPYGSVSLEDLKERLGADDVRVRQSYKPVAFARMIGKIAYSFAVAEGQIDPADRRPPITKSIIGEEDQIGRYVGAYTDPLTGSPRHLHEVRVERDKKRGLLIGSVKLFAFRPAPVYGVVLDRV